MVFVWVMLEILLDCVVWWLCEWLVELGVLWELIGCDIFCLYGV